MTKALKVIALIAVSQLTGCALISMAPAVEVGYDVPTNSAQDLVEKHEAEEHWDKVEEVRDLLVALSPEVDDREADMLARAAVFYPMQLAADYQQTWPAIIHNYRVNGGRRPRGLCIHWAEDMILEFAELRLQTIELHWGVANLDKTWPLEHSCVVATAPGQSFEEGVVLDGWRNSGKLYYGPVVGDKYQWQELFNQVTDEVDAIVAGQPVPPRDPNEVHTMSHAAKTGLVEAAQNKKEQQPCEGSC